MLKQMNKKEIGKLLEEVYKSITNGYSVKQLEKYNAQLKEVSSEDKKYLRFAIKIIEEVIRLKKEKKGSGASKIYLSILISLLFIATVSASINWKVNGQTYFTFDQNTTDILEDLFVQGDLNMVGAITHNSPVIIKEGIALVNESGASHILIYHADSDANNITETHPLYNESAVFEVEHSNNPFTDFLFWDKDDQKALLDIRNDVSIFGGDLNVSGSYYGDGSQLTNLPSYSPNPTPYSINSEDMIGYWTGENNTLDYSGQNHNGTLGENATYSDGIFGKGFEFDGDGDYIDMGDVDMYEFADNFSVSAWVKVPDLSDVNAIASKGGGSPNGWDLSFNSDEQPSILSNSQSATGSAVTQNEWHHIVGAYNGTDLLLYVDGSLEDTQTTSLTQNTGKVFSIGSQNGAQSQFFNGSIDEVMIFNRSLSATEISELYTSMIMFTTELWTNSSGAATFTTGFVGIGTTSPDYIFHILDNAPLTKYENARTIIGIGYFIGGLLFNAGEDSVNNDVAEIRVTAHEDWTNISYPTRMEFSTTSSGSTSADVRMTISPEGNVGIGTSNPTQPLLIMGNGGTAEVGITQNQVGGLATMEFTTEDLEGNQATKILLRGTSNTSDIEFYTGGRGGEQVIMFIEGSNGFVGIGTNSPTQALDVDGNITADYFFGDGSQLIGVSTKEFFLPAGSGIVDNNAVHEDEAIVLPDGVTFARAYFTFHLPSDFSSMASGYPKIVMKPGVGGGGNVRIQFNAQSGGVGEQLGVRADNIAEYTKAVSSTSSVIIEEDISNAFDDLSLVASDSVQVYVQRDSDDALDTLAGDLDIVGVIVKYD